MPEWYYFGQNGVLQEFVGRQALEAKLKTQIPTNIMGNNMIVQKRNESIIFEHQRSYHTLKTGWIFDEGHWYYLAEGW